MTDIKLHEGCKVLSQAVYQKDKPKNINGWEYVDKYYNNQTGYYSELYKKGDKVILAIRGSDLNLGANEARKDLWNDVRMGLAMLPNQVENAKTAYNELADKYGKENITVTGHSLGGSISGVLGTEFGVEAVTFNAYGIRNLNKLKINYTDNITNYGNANDGVFVSNIDSHLGKIMILNANGEGKCSHKNISKFKNFDNHKLENLSPLSEAKEYKKENFEQDKTPLFRLSTEYNQYPDELFTLDNRVFHGKELDPNTEINDDVMQSYIRQFLEKKKMPSKEELDKRVHIGNLIYVEEYSRSDGTKVSGYYRAYPR